MRLRAKITPQKEIQVSRIGLPQRVSVYALAELDLTNLDDGDVLVWNDNDGKFIAQKLLDKQEVTGGQY